MKIPGVAPSSLRGWIQPESNNLIALALFVAFAGLGAVVYAFQRQTETRRLRAEAEVASLARDQVELDLADDQLTSGPATAANSLSPVLDAQAGPAPTSEHTGSRIEPQVHTDQTARVITSIDNMLALSRIADGSMRPAKQRVSLRGMLDQLLLPNLKQAQEKRLKLRCVLHAGVPLEIVTDQEKMLHILGNLVGNAIKYTLRGEVVVSVRREGDSESCRLSFEVADTGPGIRSEDQKRVFEPYFQSGTPSQDAFNGLGLGLTVAQRLAQLLGGDVTLESQTGKGTVCIVLLPVEVPSEATPRVTATEELALGSAALATRSATVTRLPAANDAFSARGDGFQRRQEPVYATRPER
jgi:two-component system secretion sensor histidine kinase SsrA